MGVRQPAVAWQHPERHIGAQQQGNRDCHVQKGLRTLLFGGCVRAHGTVIHDLFELMNFMLLGFSPRLRSVLPLLRLLAVQAFLLTL